MGWARLVSLGCDGEPCWSGPYESSTDDLEEARQQAARYDKWSYDEESDKDFCRQCTKAREGN